MPWGDAHQKSGDFVSHINLRHKFEYERFVVSPQLVCLQCTKQQCSLFCCPFSSLVHQDLAKDDDEQLRVAIEKSKMVF